MYFLIYLPQTQLNLTSRGKKQIPRSTRAIAFRQHLSNSPSDVTSLVTAENERKPFDPSLLSYWTVLSSGNIYYYIVLLGHWKIDETVIEWFYYIFLFWPYIKTGSVNKAEFNLDFSIQIIMQYYHLPQSHPTFFPLKTSVHFNINACKVNLDFFFNLYIRKKYSISTKCI